MSVTVEALKAIGRYKPGDTFELSERDATAFVALGVAKRQERRLEVAAHETVRMQVAEQEEKPTMRRRSKRREYKRRDLQAED
jgi:hypothetical protein